METLKVLRIIHWGITIPIVIFGTYVLYQNITGPVMTDPVPSVPLLYLPWALLIITFPLGNFLFRSYIRRIPGEAGLDRKLKFHQTGHIIRIALFESAALFSIIVAFLTTDNISLIPAVVVLGIFFTSQPTVYRIESILELSLEEKAALRRNV